MFPIKVNVLVSVRWAWCLNTNMTSGATTTFSSQDTFPAQPQLHAKMLQKLLKCNDLHMIVKITKCHCISNLQRILLFTYTEIFSTIPKNIMKAVAHFNALQCHYDTH